MAIADMSSPAIEVHPHIIVKNTFFDLADEKPKCRGSSSLPPSLRLAGLCAGSKSRPRTPRHAGGKLAFDDGSSDTGCSSDGCSTVETATALELSDAEASSSDDNGSTLDESPSSAHDQCTPCVMPHASLNPRAQAWTPVMNANNQELQIHMVQVQGIANAIVTALGSMSGVLRTQVVRHDGGWSVAAEVPASELQKSRGRLLRRAQQMLLAAAEHSSSVYVLGYRQKPFTESDLGFSATLCDVQDTNAACWKYLETGVCRFQCQGRCHWSHPWCQTMIEVAVLPSAAAAS